MSVEAVFEVKTYSASMTNYSTDNRAVAPPDRRGAKIIREYKTKLKNIDEKFAAEVVGNGSSDTVGPFEMSLGRFYKGRVIPLVVGWFGETNKNFEQTIATLAKETAASDFGRTLSPLVNTEKKEEPCPSCCSSLEEQLESKL